MIASTVPMYMLKLCPEASVHGHVKRISTWAEANARLCDLYYDLFSSPSTPDEYLSENSIAKCAKIVNFACESYKVTLPCKMIKKQIIELLLGYCKFYYNETYMVKYHIDHKIMLHDKALNISTKHDRDFFVKMSNKLRKEYNKVQPEMDVETFFKVWNARIPEDKQINKLLDGRTDLRVNASSAYRLYMIGKIDIEYDTVYHRYASSKERIKANVWLRDVLVSLYMHDPHIISIYRLLCDAYAVSVLLFKGIRYVLEQFFNNLIYINENSDKLVKFIRTLKTYGFGNIVKILSDKSIDKQKKFELFKNDKRVKMIVHSMCEYIKFGVSYEPGIRKYLDNIIGLVLRFSITHNQMCACLLHLYKVKTDNRELLPVSLVMCSQLLMGEFDSIKFVNNLIKGGGLNEDVSLNVLIEMQSLYGKYDDDSCIDKDIEYRIDKDKCKEYINKVSKSKLKIVVEKIMSKSMQNCGPVKVDLDLAWKRRWATCKGGAHKVRDERRVLGMNHDYKGVEEITKRHFVEKQEKNILYKTKPMCLISPSIKNENGKNRIIYSCDTINYLNFDVVMRKIESVFVNERIILNPGSENLNAMYKKLRTRSGHINLSLDYEDFNSQHSIEDMKIVVNALRPYIGDKYCNWLLASFDNMYVFYQDKWNKWYHSLPSGHRLTTFINSILNYAYIDIMLGEYNITDYDSIHTGDDCVIFIHDMESVDTIIDACIDNKLNIRLNKSKQCLNTTFEFLRVCVSRSCGRGYINRSFASLVNGNWTSGNILNHKEYIACLNQMVYTLYNRGGQRATEGLVCSVMRHTQLDCGESIQYIRGRLCLNDGMIFGSDDICESVSYDYNYICDNITIHNEKRYATNDFLQYCLTEVERNVINRGNYYGYLIKQMASASYKCKRYCLLTKYNRDHVRRCTGIRIIDGAGSPLKKEGVLEYSLPFMYLKNILTDDDISYIIKHLCGDDSHLSNGMLWGIRAQPIFCRFGIPYSTATSFAKRVCRGSYIGTDFPVFL